MCALRSSIGLLLVFLCLSESLKGRYRLFRCSAGTVSSERGFPAFGPAERFSWPAPGRAARGPSKGQHHQRGAGLGLLTCLQLPPRRPLPSKPVYYPQQAIASHWYVIQAQENPTIWRRRYRSEVCIQVVPTLFSSVFRYITSAAARLCWVTRGGPRAQ